MVGCRRSWARWRRRRSWLAPYIDGPSSAARRYSSRWSRSWFGRTCRGSCGRSRPTASGWRRRVGSAPGTSRSDSIRGCRQQRPLCVTPASLYTHTSLFVKSQQNNIVKIKTTAARLWTPRVSPRRCSSCLEFTPSYNHRWSGHLCTSF